MNLCLGSLVILLSQCDRESPYRKITFQFFKLKDLRKIQAIVSAGIVFALCFALSIAVFIFAVDSAQFFYWFNFGQPPHEIRKIHIWDFANHGNLFVPAYIAFYFAYRTVRMDLLFVGVFFICYFVVSSNSGLDYTAFFFFLFAPIDSGG